MESKRWGWRSQQDRSCFHYRLFDLPECNLALKRTLDVPTGNKYHIILEKYWGEVCPNLFWWYHHTFQTKIRANWLFTTSPGVTEHRMGYDWGWKCDFLQMVCTTFAKPSNHDFFKSTHRALTQFAAFKEPLTSQNYALSFSNSRYSACCSRLRTNDSTPQLQTKEGSALHLHDITRRRSGRFAEDRWAAQLTASTHPFKMQSDLYGWCWYLQLTDCMRAPPQAAWWAWQAHWLLVPINNIFRTRIRYEVSRMSCSWVGSTTAPRTPWGHPVYNTDGPQHHKMGIESGRW